MTEFLHLPEEVILNVIQHLAPHPQAYSGPSSSWSWGVEEEKSEDIAQRVDLRALSRCNRYLFGLIEPFVHSYPHINGNGYMSSFLKALNTYPNLQSRITHAHIDYDKIKPHELSLVFHLPRIHTITITGISYYGHAVDPEHSSRPSPDPDTYGKSPVQVLRLLNCMTLAHPFVNIMRRPAQLRELWYDGDIEDWSDRHNIDTDDFSLSCQHFEAALESHKSSLERLIITRFGGAGTRLVPNKGYLLNLSEFPNLRSFAMDYCEALEAGDRNRIWRCLSPNLEELELDYANVHSKIYAYWEPIWLYELLDQDQKRKYAPALKRVRIMFLEWIDGPSPAGTADSHYLDDPTGAKRFAQREHWIPPSGVMRRFEEARVSYSIFTDTEKRYKHVIDGEQEFNDPWEDVWFPPKPRAPDFINLWLEYILD